MEIPTYIAFTYQTSAWTVANVVAYGFLMHFDHIIQVTDLSMKKFCIGTCITVALVSVTLDYFVPYYNTVVYHLFGRSPDMDRYVMQIL